MTMVEQARAMITNDRDGGSVPTNEIRGIIISQQPRSGRAASPDQ
jgi:hypothetical protein